MSLRACPKETEGVPNKPCLRYGKREMKISAVILVAAAALGGCQQPEPPTALQTAWNRYQVCVHHTQNATVQCERLKLAYETQLNRAPR